ncbi:MAG TPA: nitrous oxide reductase accessory protein NosL [Panacibacter sp.]|nr:nitrous oxide reductase accessory protein NosL [Panacibacter sp.]
MKNSRLAGWVRAIVILCGLALFAVLLVPMWQIQLSAPQYPEGLVLLIYPNALGGNVDIINGLNHYIGMRTLHAEDFMEFTILPYIIGFFGCITLLTGLLNRKKLLPFLTILFIAFAVIAMVDFWRWEYNYGHDLNPEAAIVVPGMAYQPPLIGYKQLLNFGAYSIPDIGGWIFIAVGVLLATVTVYQIVLTKKMKKIKTSVITNKPAAMLSSLFILLLFCACSKGPQPLQLGKDNCDFCQMTVSDARFGAEIVTIKGKVFKFDDMHCILTYIKSGILDEKDIKDIYLVDFSGTHELKNRYQMFLLKSDDLRSPMGGNIAAFSSRDSLSAVMNSFKGQEIQWDNIETKLSF